MYLWPRNNVFEPNFLTPREINDELAAMVATAHSLDGDNFDAGELTKARMEQSVCGGVYRVGVDGTTDDITILGSNANNNVIHIPLSGGANWIDTFDTADGVIEITLSLTVGDSNPGTGTEGLAMWVGVLIDGVMAAQSPTDNGGGDLQAMTAIGTFPVGAGTHVVEAVFGAPVHLGAGRVVRFHDRILSIIEGAR